MDDLWKTIEPHLISSGLSLARAILIVLIGWLVIPLVVGTARRLMQRTRLGATWANYLARVAHGILLLIIFLAALSALGVETTSIIALVGAGALAVALAWQASLSHLASGLMILGLRLFRVGDQIEVLGVKGRVEDIQLFHTILTDADRVRIILPNGKVTDNVIRNYGA